MNLRDLRYLVAVARHRHFGRAAQACHVTQPTLSAQIKKLEQTLGVRLFERRRDLLLTDVGRQVVTQAAEVLRGVDALMEVAQAHRDPLGGTLRMGVIPTVAPYLLPVLLPEVYARLPDLTVEIVEGLTNDILGLLKAGALDATILALPVTADDMVQTPLFDEPFYFAVSPRHPRAGRDSVFEAELDQERVLLAADLGVTLMPELAVRGFANVRYIPFADTDGPRRTIGICWRGCSTRMALFETLTPILRVASARRRVAPGAIDEGAPQFTPPPR